MDRILTIKRFKKFIVIAVSILVLASLLYKPIYQAIEIHQKRVELSNHMGVSLKEYPYLPINYLSEVITPGMKIEDVHNIVVGYEKVFSNSYSDHSGYEEIYFYFYSSEKKAHIFKIFYDKEYKVDFILVDAEPNSRTITAKGWQEGLLER